MKKEQVVRTFRLADSALKQKADELIALIDRDITEFTDRGYNADKKAELTTARTAVDNFPSDEQLVSIKMNLTNRKMPQEEPLKNPCAVFLRWQSMFSDSTVPNTKNSAMQESVSSPMPRWCVLPK